MNSPEMLNGCEQLVEMEQCRTSMRSAEGGGSLMSKSPTVKVLVDIEHANVEDDPRQWSKTRKYIIVAMISTAAMNASLGSSIYNPAITQIEADLHASEGQLSLTLSLYILAQGTIPLIWSSASEVQGRKAVYLASVTLCMLGCIVAATSKTIQVLIGMRVLQAAGSSAVMSLGAATLADIYDPAERGTMMGIYYSAPMLGPALGPILGGVLAQGFNWRAIFWFLAIFAGICSVSFVFFRETFRRERSLTYQTVLKRMLKQEAKKKASEKQPALDQSVHGDADAERTAPEIGQDTFGPNQANRDFEAQVSIPAFEVSAAVKEVRLTLKDVNPFRPMFLVLKRVNNVLIMSASGFLFAFTLSVTYTAARTLAHKYHYDALYTGLVLLAYGVGCLLGSILGGRYSDYMFAKMTAKYGAKTQPEMRLRSTRLSMLFFPPSVVAYGWVCQKHIHVSAICVTLFLAGFFQICIYTSTLVYMVDANVGRSASAAALNSFFRGIFAFVATELAVPLQDSMVDGGLYTLWGGLTIISELLILLVWWKGAQWREDAIAREKLDAAQQGEQA